MRKLAFAVAFAFTALAADQPAHKLTSPKEALGFEIGDDYQLATYTQLAAWWKKLAAESDRMKLVEIGQTEEGRPQLMAILTSPENHRKLAHYKEISRRLAQAEGLTDEQAHALAHEGKAVVWIDGGLHATDVLGAHQLMEFVYEMVTRNETPNIHRHLSLEWFPQIVYNPHQPGPAGAVLFAPPFRDPFNYHFDPLIPLQIDLVGAAMHSRFAEEGKPGATMRSGAP